jgi:hypothetical protein
LNPYIAGSKHDLQSYSWKHIVAGKGKAVKRVIAQIYHGSRLSFKNHCVQKGLSEYFLFLGHPLLLPKALTANHPMSGHMATNSTIGDSAGEFLSDAAHEKMNFEDCWQMWRDA